MAVVSAGRRRTDLHSSNVFVDPNLRADHHDYLPWRRSFHASSCGRANESEPLNVRIRMMSRSRNQKRNLSLIPSLNLSRILSQRTRMH